MSVDKGKQPRTYNEMISDCVHMKERYGSTDKMFEDYRVKGYIPVHTTKDQFLKLVSFVNSQLRRKAKRKDLDTYKKIIKII